MNLTTLKLINVGNLLILLTSIVSILIGQLFTCKLNYICKLVGYSLQIVFGLLMIFCTVLKSMGIYSFGLIFQHFSIFVLLIINLFMLQIIHSNKKKIIHGKTNIYFDFYNKLYDYSLIGFSFYQLYHLALLQNNNNVVRTIFDKVISFTFTAGCVVFFYFSYYYAKL